jgi:hypothetical protein
MPGDDPDALARDTLEATLTGLRHGSPVTFNPGSRCDGLPVDGERTHE